MKRNLKTILSIGGIILIASTLIFSVSTNDNQTEKTIENKDHFFPLPSNVNFAGEKTPVHILDVKERLDRELIVNTNLHSSTILVIKRAERYFPVIEPILKKNGIPDDFKYLCVIESSLSNAVSSAGASGFWQFMKGTAKDYNLTVNDYVDERYDLEKATEKACEYFKNAYDRFNNWTLVAAAFNRGTAGITRAIDSQYVNNYYDLFLNQETSRYVFRILALKEIMNNANKYGFDIPVYEKYNPVKTKKIMVDYDIEDLALFAKEQGINYKLLKLYNPWLINTKLKTENKVYYIKIPIEGI